MSQLKSIEQIKTGNVNVKTGEEEKGIRWVKCSERFPEKFAWYICRCGQNKIIHSILFNPDVDIAEERFEMATGYDKRKIEWLEESAPDQSSQIKLLQEQIRKQEEEVYRSRDGGWISVEDRLPDTSKNKFHESEVVLVYDETYFESAVGWYNSNSKEWFIYHHLAQSTAIPVTHWMEFKEPPKKP